jgi:hypothetical protein
MASLTKPPSWRTTTLGALTILGVLVAAGNQYLTAGHIELAPIYAGISTGIGLIMAGDHANQ